jgi:hypothetical protein
MTDKQMDSRTEVPPNPDQEAFLLAAFDAHWTRQRSKPRHWIWTTAAAALIAVTGVLGWIISTSAPEEPTQPPDAAADMAGFVPWPDAGAWPRFESGMLVRVDLPVSALAELGVSAASADSVIELDIVIGQDGLARAVRFVQ